MRLPVEFSRSRKLHLIAAFCGSTMLVGCASGGGADLSGVPPVAGNAAATSGPAADYPVVVGEPYYVGNTLYTPVDTLNYDEVGYANVEAGAMGYTAAHHTLPIPSYVEVTDLDTGRTVVLRVEARGPMENNALLALSPAAMAQLGARPNSPIRVRRVTPAEDHRAALRQGQAAPLRMDTPESLLVVLRKTLPTSGSASLQPNYDTARAVAGSGNTFPPPGRAVVQAPMPASTPSSEQPQVAAQGAQPLPPLDQSVPARSTPVAAPAVRPAPASAARQAEGRFVVQAAAFGNRSNADRVARVIDGQVSQAGQFWRVRTGPFSTRREAEASLAKVRSAGYADARIFTDG